MQRSEHRTRDQAGGKTGHVDLIGCGPGDPELLTVKAIKALSAADVLVVDRLVGSEIAALAHPDARRIDVGKTPYAPSISQDDINRILLREAFKGHRVARLKGGDPGIFGRLAEEVSFLRAAGISVSIIPGVTAAHACAATIGLPVTLRHEVRQFSVITGATAGGDPELDWPALARSGHAFAIYMGVKDAAKLAATLVQHGAPELRSVVVVENGSRPDQRTVHTTLADLGEAIGALKICGPAIIFVGLDWAQANLTRPDDVEVFGRLDSEPCSAEKHRPDKPLHIASEASKPNLST